MVSLENRVSYLSRIHESAKLTVFHNLLLNKGLPAPQTIDKVAADEIFFECCNALYANDKSAFEAYYNKKNKSHPSKESPSPFVNDDFLLFSLIVGIMRFGLDKEWMKSILILRSRSPITITLENILNENYYSKSNLFEIITIYFDLNSKSLMTNEFLNNTYKGLLENTGLFESKNDFQILAALRAYDLVVELKDTGGGKEMGLLRQFNVNFIKRVKILAWFVQTALLVSILYFLIELISLKPELKIYFDKTGSVLKILGLFGISQIGNVFPFLRKIINHYMLRLLGYPKLLVKELHKAESK
jgi:hypothetical protein